MKGRRARPRGPCRDHGVVTVEPLPARYLARDLLSAGLTRRAPLVVVLAADGLGLAWEGGSRALLGGRDQLVEALVEVERHGELAPRWTWWSARTTATPLVQSGFRPRATWDLAASGRLACGSRRVDPGAVWAAAHDLPEPDELGRGDGDLFDLDASDGRPVLDDGQLSREWRRGAWATDTEHARRWAELGLEVRRRQEAVLAVVPDPRPGARHPPLALLTAYAESAAALLAVELEVAGLPLDADVVGELLLPVIGSRPADEAQQADERRARDEVVLQHVSGAGIDLRNSLHVRELLAGVGLDLPDTRSWRLEPHAGTLPVVASLLAWRKAERLATTYGWSWLDQNVDADGRLRGRWEAADGASGRMTASAGLHNLPAELRPAVRAQPGHVLVRADLGQVEPRVLAAVSGDSELARAAGEDDMYAPVARKLGCDRPTAKIAVLAAMYGQTSGAAGAALRDMDRAYPVAMAHLRAAEQVGQQGGERRTYGGRLLLLRGADQGEAVGEHVVRPAGWGRFARNAVVQGAAAELFKAWAATVRDGLLELDGEIVLCLHDELLLHVPTEVGPAAVALLDDALQATAAWWAAGSPVRFVVDVGTGSSWAEAH